MRRVWPIDGVPVLLALGLAGAAPGARAGRDRAGTVSTARPRWTGVP
jgi:hypothetical protein